MWDMDVEKNGKTAKKYRPDMMRQNHVQAISISASIATCACTAYLHTEGGVCYKTISRSA